MTSTSTISEDLLPPPAAALFSVLGAAQMREFLSDAQECGALRRCVWRARDETLRFELDLSATAFEFMRHATVYTLDAAAWQATLEEAKSALRLACPRYKSRLLLRDSRARRGQRIVPGAPDLAPEPQGAQNALSPA